MRDREHAAHQRLEVVVAGDEIGLGIDFDDDAEIGFDGDADEALGGDAAALLGRLGEALLAQPVDGRLDVAVGLAERVLAIHHAGAGLLAQVLHQRGGDRWPWLFLGGYGRPRGGSPVKLYMREGPARAGPRCTRPPRPIRPRRSARAPDRPNGRG